MKIRKFRTKEVYNIGPKTKWRSKKLERLAQSATDTLAQCYKTFYALIYECLQ